jgi:HK97 family phage prohead protease
MAEALKRRLRMQVRATPDKGPGTGTAVISTYDLEYPIGWGWTEKILSGCFADSIAAHPTVPVFHQHDWDAGPIGVGNPTEDDDKLTIDFRLYLKMGDLVDRVYQAMLDEALEEWSIGFWASTIISDEENDCCDQIAKGDLAEASICVRGANPETGTLELASVKGWVVGDEPARERELIRVRSLIGANVPDLDVLRERKATPNHSTAIDTGSWDGPGNEKKLETPLTISIGNREYAWRDPDKDETTKGAWSFPHHIVGDGGTPGAANVKACQSIIGILNGARGGSNIPDADRQGVWSHAAKHLRDAGEEPAELKSEDALDLLDRVLGLLTVGDLAGAHSVLEEALQRDANDPNDPLAGAEVGTHTHAHTHDDGETHSHEHTHNPSVADHDATDGDVAHSHDHPEGPESGVAGDPADEESSKERVARAVSTPWGRRLLALTRKDPEV